MWLWILNIVLCQTQKEGTRVSKKYHKEKKRKEVEGKPGKGKKGEKGKPAKGREEKEKPAKGELEKGIDNLYCLRVDLLLGNATKAEKELGWKREFDTLDKLIEDMFL